MTHAAILKRVGLPTVETLTRRILRSFDAATPADVESGAQWYSAGRALAVDLMPDDVERAAVVIAHLSPRTEWSRNVAGAITLIREGERHPGLIGANFDKATAALSALDPWVTFGPKSPKTRAFAANLSGDDETVTVDVWAARVVGCDEATLAKVGVYDAIAHAYRLAAGRRGVSPATMQATTWIVARGGRAN